MGSFVGEMERVGLAVVGPAVGLGEVVGEDVPPGRMLISAQLKNSVRRSNKVI